MSTPAVRLSRRLVNRILHRAVATPNGALLGVVGEVGGRQSEFYPIAGYPETPVEAGAEFESEAVAAIIRELQGQGGRAFAICRSHPSTPPQPVAGEMELADRWDLLLLVVSLNTKGVLELRGFRPAAGSMAVEVELLLEPES